MKYSKLNLAGIITIIIVSLTIATKANFGKRTITGCFQILTVTDGTSNDIITQIGGERPDCFDAIIRIIIRPYVRVASAPLNSGDECPPSDVYFCCVTLQQVSSAPSGVPLLDLGEGLHFYEVHEIYCKETQSLIK